MKLKKITAALLFSFIFAPCMSYATSATINGGEVKFRGQVVAAPCSVKADDINKTVEMGQVRTNNFPTKGTWYDPVAFQIHLEDCDTTVLTTVAVRFDGISDTNDPQVFQTGNGAGAAQGLGLGIFDYTGTLLVPNTRPKNFFPLSDGENVLHFTAKYRSTLSQVHSGDASGTVWFMMIYQ
ncbi:fimbrial protein [Enterobacter quasiroggenkampii]|uniref:fimbrial protein n=1 Tax=Enterobacter quasiroggenkampii TaxID=2497436 RepID=UPI0021D1DE8B|nr:fimbrial protein [Enterobacter quasiroggenkampii]MCU6306347.1 type 1 fimbrial protein [Enterobacter quasiroggenkampii]MCU6398427.1 type 1 fimbrial protein [Enterobacter quasiroggenkampii]